MDNRYLYDYIFTGLDAELDERLKQLTENNKRGGEHFSPLFVIGSSKYRKSKQETAELEKRSIAAFEALVVKLCERYDIPFEYCPADEESYDESRPFQIIRTEDRKRIGYVFCDNDNTLSEHIGHFLKGSYPVDKLEAIMLIAPEETNYELVLNFTNIEFSGKHIHLTSIATLFKTWFGEEELSVLTEYIHAYNEKAEKLLDVSVCHTTSEMSELVIQQDFSYDSFTSWLEMILRYRLPEDTETISLEMEERETGEWALQLIGMKVHHKGLISKSYERVFSSGNVKYRWTSSQSEKELVGEICRAVQQYMTDGAFKDQLAAYRWVGVLGYDHREFPYVREE